MVGCVVFSFSCGSRAVFAVNRHAVNRHAVNCELQDNREIVARYPRHFPINRQVSRKEGYVVGFVTGCLVQFNG